MKEQLFSPTFKPALPSGLLYLTLLLGALAWQTTACADPAIRHYNIPAGPMANAVNQLAETGGIQAIYDTQVTQGRVSKGLQDSYSTEAALQKLLAGTGLAYSLSGGTVNIRAERNPVVPVANPTLNEPASETTLPKVTVEADAGNPYDDPNWTNDPYNTDYNRPNASTATKTNTPIMDTPLSIQVVPQAVIKDQQAFRIQDAVKNVSGVQQIANDGYDDFIIRGFNTTRIGYRNGIRVPLLNLDFANIQQVEVLKGPASILYGRIEPGGMINAVTKRPQEEAYYSLEQRFGSYDFYRTEANATGAITDDKSLLYRLDFSYLDKNSFRDFVYNDRIFIAPSLTWRPSNRTEFNLSYDYLNEDRVFDPGQPAIGDSVAQIPISRNFGHPGLSDHFGSDVIDFNWSHKFSDQWQVRNGVVATFLDEDWNEIYTFFPNDENRTVDRFSWFGGRTTSAQTVYLDLNGKFDTFGIKHNILIGGDYYSLEQEGTATDQFVDTVDVFNPVRSDLDIDALRNDPHGFNSVVENSWYGIYFQDQITLWDKLHILGGGRYDITTSGTRFSGTSLDDAHANFTDIEINKFSPRVGILYQPWHWLSLYGNYVESIGATNQGPSATNTPFDPETAEQYEAGFKTELFDSRLTSTVAFYHLTKNNILTRDPDNFGFSVVTGKARSQGIEVDVSGQITNELSLIGTYAWTDTRILQDNRGNQGNRLFNVPLHSGSLWLKYDFQQAFLKGFSFGAGVYAADKRFGDNANSFSDGAYARVDMMAAYKFNIGPTRLTTQVNINNVTDTEYFLLPNDKARNIPAEPLSVFGSIRLEY